MSEKPQLPFGWVVKQSKSYPDRVYYFNINSGASTWEFPDLVKAYNISSAGPVSPPILSATSFNPGLGTTVVQSPLKQPPEPTFSPQFSDSDNDGSHSDNSPAPHNKQTFERPSHQMPSTPYQRYGSGYVPTQTPNYPHHGAAKFKGSVNNERPGQLGPCPLVTSPKHDKPGQVYQNPIHGIPKSETSYGATKFKGSAINEMPGLLGHCPPVTRSKSDKPGQVYGTSIHGTSKSETLYGATKFKGSAINERPGLLGPCPLVTSPKHDKPGQVYGTPKSETSPFYGHVLGAGNTSEQSKTLLKSPVEFNKTPATSSGLERPKAPSAKRLDESFKASASKTFNNKFVNNSAEDKVLASSCPGKNAYNKAIKILSKSVEKTVTHLGKLVNLQGSKSDIKVDSGSGLSQRKSLISLSGNERKPLEKDINDNIKSSGKKRQLDKDITNSSEKDVKKKRLDKTIEVVVQSNILSPDKIKTKTHSTSPVKKGESKSIKRKSSEILPRDSKFLNLDDSSDRRKVVKSATKDTAPSRSVVIKNTPVKFGTTSAISEDLKVQTSINFSQNALGSSRSFTRQESEDSNLSLELPEDTDQSGILRQFIGDKDKLLSIQSWIDNLHDGAGSSNASFDSFSESLSGDTDDKRVVISDKSTDCDSGYLSPPLKPAAKTERGWPGEAKKSDIASREITAMEIDDIELPESDVKFQEEDMVIDLMLSEVRVQMKSNPEKVCGTLTATVAELQEFMKEQESQEKLYIVIDTNVIISDLEFIRDLKDQEIMGYGKPVLYIPWIVLQELDSLKQACTKGMPKLTAATQNKASRGIKMLQHMFRIKHPQIKGQTPMESQEAARVFRAECNDDIILMTCLHHRKLNAVAEVVLLTNDNNLINKALVCAVNAYNRKDLHSGLEKLQQRVSSCQSNINIPRSAVTPEKFIPISRTVHSTPTGVQLSRLGQVSFKPVSGPSTSAGSSSIAQNLLKEEKSYTVEKLAEDIHCKLKGLLKAGMGKVLQTEMELAYSDMWQEIVFRKPPWSLRDILDSIKKHWIAVFGLVFQRSLVKQIDYLIENFREEKVYSLEDLAVCSREASVFLQKCVSRNMYGSAMINIKESVQHLQHLCDSVCKGETSVQSISSLENYLKQQPSSQPSRICDKRGENTYLVSKHNKTNTTDRNNESVSPYCGTMVRNSNSSQPHPAGGNDNFSVSSPASRNVNQPLQSPTSWELAARKLQKIWQHIYASCDEMRKMLNSGMGENVLSAIERTLSMLVPAAKEIRTEYVVVLEIPLSQLPGHMDKIGSLANQCNNFFSNVQLSDEGPPVDAESFLALFRNIKQRESLNMLLTQLDEMLCHLYKCLHHLDPGD